MSEQGANLDALLASLQAPETVPPEAALTPPTAAEMLPPESTPAPESADAADPTPEETPPPSNLKDLAAKAGLDVKQLYDMEIPGLEGMTLGQVKDRAKELSGVDATREAVETERAGLRQERLNWRRELAAAQQAGLHTYTEQEKAHIGQLLQRHADAEAQTIMAAVPEWANQATLKADFEGITELLKPYGFTAPEVAQMLESDARLTLFVKNSLDRSRRVKAAEAKIKAPPKKLQAPAGSIAKLDAAQRILNDPKSSPIDKGLAALMQGAKR